MSEQATGGERYGRILDLLSDLKAMAESTEGKVDALCKTEERRLAELEQKQRELVKKQEEAQRLEAARRQKQEEVAATAQMLAKADAARRAARRQEHWDDELMKHR